PHSEAIQEPVLIDPALQRVYAITGVEPAEGGFTLNIPLADWPLIIADRRAIPLAGAAGGIR
ncbi:MAG TPA: hypothetical protein VHR86_04855, partial [Armatimonadota bacterium]|nr:hypothetical protein [Armatimonadota bacterium]